MGRNAWFAAIAAWLLSASCGNAGAATVLLFDGDTGPLPGELLFAGTGGTQSIVADGVMLDSTTDSTDQVGYTNWAELPLPPPLLPVTLITPSIDLDRAAGIRLDFELRVDFESHELADRSGFSVIVITNDLKGIELGFWTNEIWAQNEGFTHGEGSTHDTMGTSLTSYSLQIQDLEYDLLADGALLIENGSLRDYSARGLIYDEANYLFFGDNTTRAQSRVTLGNITLTTPIPLPPSIALMLAACVGLLLQGRRSVK